MADNRLLDRRAMLSRREFLELSGAAGAAAMLPTDFSRAQGTGDSPKKGGILRVAHTNNPSSLDPSTGRGGSEHTILWGIFDTLVRFEPKTLTAVPGLARSWSYPDPQSLVLDLETDVLFHDGTPFDATAVKANFDRMLSNPRSTVKADIESLASVEVINAARVVLHLKFPDSAMPLILSDRAGMMASPEAFNKFGPDFDRHPVGSGPWQFVSWEDGNKASIRRNEKYWREGRPYLDGIDFRMIVDTNAGLRSVLAGENDVVYRVAAHQIPVAKRATNLEIVIGPTMWVEMVYFNYAHPPINDLRVRQAINHAIDRNAYARAILGETGEVATGLLPKSHWAYAESVADRYPYSYDPEKAKRLLAEAGFPDGCELVSLSYSDQARMRQSDIITQMLGQVGIKLRQDNGLMATINARWQSGEGDFHLSSFTGRPDPTLSYASIFSKDGVFNPAHIEPSSELVDAIRRSRASTDISERKAAFEDVQRIERANALFVPLGFEPEILVHNTRVKGYVGNLIGKPRFDDVYLTS
jgi:ABC-type transport system substrate-binding protein